MTPRQIPIVEVDGQQWYTAGGAAAVLTRRSGRQVTTTYLRSLARLEKIGVKKINESTVLYLKSDVDTYRVEERGAKAAAAMKARATARKGAVTVSST